MVNQKSTRRFGLHSIIAFSLGLCSCFLAQYISAQQSGLQRLMRRAEMPDRVERADRIPAVDTPMLDTKKNIQQPQRAAYIPPIGQPVKARRQDSIEGQLIDPGFVPRTGIVDPNFAPVPMERGMYYPQQKLQLPNNGYRDEYLLDGGDREKRLSVDQQWNIYGMDTEDTFGHFDTLSGQRLVSPSNRVAIYAPRFAAVRKVEDFLQTKVLQGPTTVDERRGTVMSSGLDLTASSKQNTQVERQVGANRVGSFIDQTRGVVADTTTHLFGVRNSYQGFENLQLIRSGKFEMSEGARTELGMQSANVWADNLGLQVATKQGKVVIAKDYLRLQALSKIKTKGDNALLRVAKVASSISASPGEYVDFTIRFDNIGTERIGNVTIVDNLTSRLEYVPDSAECSVHADFVNEVNESGSLMFRWEIRDPLPAGKGGIVRFQCRVR